jgi:Ca2+-binding RTX toxin-like protein
VLTIAGGSAGPVTLQLDPGQSFAGYQFQVKSDGAGGTALSLAKVINGGNGNSALTGTDGNDVITGGNGNDTFNGGNGNDIVSAGNGNDVVNAGNGNNDLNGGNGDDIFHVGSGSNVLTGGKGNDTFVFGPEIGKDMIADFRPGDHIEFDGVYENFQAVQAVMHQDGANTVIGLDTDHSVTFLGVNASSLHSSDFILH